MELTKHPETELEYWGTIEELGGFMHSMRHGINKGRIEDKDGGVQKDIQEAYNLQTLLVKEIGEKFGVIHPNECPKVEIGQRLPKAPGGKKYYWSWYKKMQARAWGIQYKGMICSACPYSEGLRRMIALGQVPCGLWRGYINQLDQPHLCAILNWPGNNMNRDEFLQKMKDEKGPIAVTRFIVKELELITSPKTAL